MAHVSGSARCQMVGSGNGAFCLAILALAHSPESTRLGDGSQWGRVAAPGFDCVKGWPYVVWIL